MADKKKFEPTYMIIWPPPAALSFDYDREKLDDPRPIPTAALNRYVAGAVGKGFEVKVERKSDDER